MDPSVRGQAISLIKQGLTKHPLSGEVVGNEGTSALTKNTVRMKVLLLGDVGSGKSSLLNKFCYGKFADEYRPTIKVDFGTKKIEQKYFVVAVGYSLD